MKTLELSNPSSVFELTKEDITKSFLINHFATLGDNKNPVTPSNTRVQIDKAVIDESPSVIKFAENYSSIIGETTTVGRIIAFIFLFDIPFSFNDDDGVKKEGNLVNFIPFINEPLTKKNMGKLDGIVADLYLDGQLDHKVMEQYVNNLQWLGYTSAIYSVPSLDLKTINPDNKIRNYVNSKSKEIKAAKSTNDIRAFSKIEKDILAFCAKELDAIGATGRKIYASGWNGDFSNNFKVTSIFRGVAPKSDDASSFSIVTTNLADGVGKEDIPAHADLAVLGAAGRAKDTQLAGYKTKKFNAAFGSITADKKGSDCKTTGYKEFVLTEGDYRNHRYRYIIDNGKLVNLNKQTKGKYIGKKVKMRSPTYCNSESVCNMCLGDMYYRLKIRNIGLHVSRITTSLMNLSMKSFHNMSVDPQTYNLLDYISSSK